MMTKRYKIKLDSINSSQILGFAIYICPLIFQLSDKNFFYILGATNILIGAIQSLTIYEVE